MAEPDDADVKEIEARWGDPTFTVRTTADLDAEPVWRGSLPLDPSELPYFEQGELETVKTLGGGGMGVVELAKQRSLQREVAVKRLRPSDERSDDEQRTLMREAIHTGALEHPGIVPVYALGKSETGALMMVMKRVEGVLWSELINDPEHDHWLQLRGDQVQHHLRFVIQLCRALEFAHHRGVVHRDVKPSNVLIGAYGEVLLLDWGIAVRLEDVLVLPPGMMSGTPVYVAPEMLGLGAKFGAIGRHTDVYLLAGSLHHAITGRPPHRGVTLDGLLASIVTKPPPEYGEDVPVELATICQKALSTHPRDRYSNCAEFRRAIEDFLEHRASVELSTLGTRELRSMRKELAEGGDPVRARACFDAASLGFEQALQAWPDNPTAHAMLVDTLDLMARAHVRSRELDAARAMVARLSELDADRATRVRALIDELEAELAEAEAGRERLQRIDDDHDLDVAQRERTVGMRLLTVFVAVVVTAMIAPRYFGYSPSPTVFAVASLVLVSVGGGSLLVFRATLLRNRINRLMASVFASVLAGITFHRIYAFIRGDGVQQTVSGDGVVVGVVLGLAAVVLRDSRLVVPTVLFLVFGLVGARWPDIGFLGMGVSALASVALLAFTERASDPD